MVTVTADEWKQRNQQEQCFHTRMWLYFGISLADVELQPVDTEPQGVIPFRIVRSE